MEQENIDTEFEATIHDVTSPPIGEVSGGVPAQYWDDGSSEADVSSVMQQHQQA